MPIPNYSNYKEYVCNICDKRYYAYSDPEKCHMCGEFACSFCSKTIYSDRDNFLGIPHTVTIDGLYIFKYCIMCLTKTEIEIILQIPLNDLPIYINHKWITPGAGEVYQARFSGETIKIPVGNKYIAIKCINAPYFEFY
jgi:hypothetical protein